MSQAPSSDPNRSEPLETVERVAKYLDVAGKLNGALISFSGVSLTALIVKLLFLLGGVTVSFFATLVLTAPLTGAVAFIVGAWNWEKEFNPLGFCLFATAILLAATYLSQKSGLGTAIPVEWPTHWDEVSGIIAHYLSKGLGGIVEAPIDLFAWYFNIYPRGSFFVSVGAGALLGAVLRK